MSSYDEEIGDVVETFLEDTWEDEAEDSFPDDTDFFDGAFEDDLHDSPASTEPSLVWYFGFLLSLNEHYTAAHSFRDKLSRDTLR